MSEAHDIETGEIRPNGVAARASQSAARARVQMEHERNGWGAVGLHHSIFKAVREMPEWVKAEKTGGKGKYAPLKDILIAVRPLLLANEVRIRQGAERSYGADEGSGVKGRVVPVYTDLIHVLTGEMERTTIEIPLTRLDPQSMGSAITYGRRYTLLAALGLASDEADDDGDRAMPRDVTEQVRESADCIALKAEISKIKEATALAEWGNAPKNKQRINRLEDHEITLIRKHYQDHGAKLVEAAE